jgi:hypothetical protein
MSLVLVSIAAVAVAVSELMAFVRSRPRAGLDAFTYDAATNAEASHLTFTNLGDSPAYACVQGVVESSAKTHVFSVKVCTGHVPPHQTVHVEAPYKVGAVIEICNKPSPFGEGKVIDWSKCNFDVLDITKQ